MRKKAKQQQQHRGLNRDRKRTQIDRTKRSSASMSKMHQPGGSYTQG